MDIKVGGFAGSKSTIEEYAKHGIMLETVNASEYSLDFLLREVVRDYVVGFKELVSHDFTEAAMICLHCDAVTIECTSLETTTTQLFSESIKGLMAWRRGELEIRIDPE